VALAFSFLVAAIIHTYQNRGALGMVNDPLTRVKHALTKCLKRGKMG